MLKLTQIYLYPIKSTLAYEVSQALVQPQGLNFDREFMLTEPDGKFITARKDGELYHFSAFPIPQGLQVFHKDGSRLIIRYQDFLESKPCEVWGSQFDSLVAAEQINAWFSQKLGRLVQLRWLGERSYRRLKHFSDNRVSFADGYPLLLTNIKSLQALQDKCPAHVKMAQFRPNIVIESHTAFEEQQWDKIRIGNITFLHTKPCVRCVLTTRDPDTNLLDPKMEPFRSLKKLNSNIEGHPVFGIHLLPLNSGIIKIGDEINVLSYRP